jgi:uncharacterized membrane protein
VSARGLALLAFWLLFALVIAWHGWWLPPTAAPRWLPLALFALPLALPALGLLRRRPSALFWAATISLLHFCHGVSELWVDPDARLPAALEVALALLLICAVGWDGLQRRRRQRAASL